ncbi:phosphatase PAP2 family protein [Rhodoferax saidenbachensis]|uniref:Phosphatidic acid phosphatase type 2/haloperoxidase domain-containing protein n=1 Tax=Rhodoferax saidenbachensis TaxID=1484693 RepID=A0A1P8K9K1_9BURK|nr:phosphatase PAP2 family protein [Rhodoferax saidenbachensis]APW42663.1 hypothetical protein RS694_09045 [Rhodoferax saidenbachensis]
MDFLHNLDWVLPLRTPFSVQFAMGLSWLGYATFIMFFMSIGYWAWNKAMFYRLLILVAANALLNAYAKDVFQDPRPPLDIRLDDLVGASYGLPSGHAQLAVVMWMWLAWEVRRAWVWVGCSAIAIGVMFSRLLLGVHDIEDVLIGALLGGATLVVFEYVRHRQWRWQTDWRWSVGLTVAICALSLLTWPGTPPDYIPMLGGWLAAAIWSLQWEERHIGFRAPTAMGRRVAVGVLGALIFVGEQRLLKVAGTHWAWDPMVWSLVKGLISGTVVSLLIPWLMVRIRLAPARPH